MAVSEKKLKQSVAKLRSSENDSQERFASLLGLSSQVIRKYEDPKRSGPKDVRTLAKLASLASQRGLREIETVFTTAILEVAPELPSLLCNATGNGGTQAEPRTAKERRLVDLLLRSLRHPDDFASDLVVTALEGYGKIAAAGAKDKR